MAKFEMPKERLFGWKLKPVESTYFDVGVKPNGQLNVVLNHSLVRGCTTEMIHWWFRHFANMSVRLEDVVGYEGQRVPAYWLWHPQDHHSAELGGKTDGGCLTSGSTIHIREAMHFAQHGMKYALDSLMRVPYFGRDGMTLNRRLPMLGHLLYARIHFADVEEAGRIVGVHYHYEIAAGLNGTDPVSRFVTSRVKSKFSSAFFEAWHRHNTIEVGVFENFLPALWEQRDTPDDLVYAKSMNPDLPDPSTLKGYDEALFGRRVAGHAAARDSFEYLAPTDATFLRVG